MRLILRRQRLGFRVDGRNQIGIGTGLALRIRLWVGFGGVMGGTLASITNVGICIVLEMLIRGGAVDRSR